MDATAFIALTLSLNAPLWRTLPLGAGESRGNAVRASVMTMSPLNANSVTFCHHMPQPAGENFKDSGVLCCSAANFGLGQFNRSAQIDLIQQPAQAPGPILV